tara:strand:+ start:4994 stop:5920 length:927 start_codon:yes stop_codon:yes gene_type:complete
MRLFLFFFLLSLSFATNAEVMRVTILGSGTPRLDINRFGQSILVEADEQKLLFDVGRGAALRLNQMNISPSTIQNIFFTHLHSDHIVGFPDLLMTGWVYQRKEPLQIYGPLGTKSFVENIKKAFVEDIKIRTQSPENLDSKAIKFSVNNIKEGLIYESGELKVFAIEVDHGGGVEHAFGYKIIYKDKSVVISGDTNYSEEIVKSSKNVDLLIHEIADAPTDMISKSKKIQGIMNYHTTPKEIANIIEESKPKLVVLNHILFLGGVTSDQVLEKIYNNLKTDVTIKIAYDLMSIEFADKVNIYSSDYSQ